MCSSKSLSTDRRNLLRGSVLSTLQPILSLVLGIFISVLIDKYILDESYGIFSWFSLLNSFLGTMIIFSIPSAIQRHLAVAVGAKNREDVNSLLKTSTVLALILAPLSGIISLIITPVIFNSFIGIGNQYSFIDLMIFVIGLTSLNISSFVVSVGRGLQEFEKIGVVQIIANIMGQVAVVILILSGLGISALMFKWVILGVLTTVSMTIVIKTLWSFEGKMYPLRPLFKYAYPTVIAFFFVYAFREFLIQGIFQMYGSHLGLYRFGLRMMGFIDALTIGFYTTLAPYYSQALGRGGFKALGSEVQWTVKISFFLFLPIIIGVVVVAPSIFLILFENYYWSYQYFIVLMIQIFLYLFQKPYYKITSATAATRRLLIITVVSSLASGVLMLLMVQYGSIFVFAGVVSNGFLLVVLAYVSFVFFQGLIAGVWLKRKTGITLGLRSVLPLVAIAGFSLVLPAFIHFLRLPVFIELITIICVVSITYLLPVRFFRLVTESEILKAMQFLPTKLAPPVSRVLTKIFVRKPKE